MFGLRQAATRSMMRFLPADLERRDVSEEIHNAVRFDEFIRIRPIDFDRDPGRIDSELCCVDDEARCRRFVPSLSESEI